MRHAWRSHPNPYLAPPQLEVEDVGPRHVLIVGACFMFGWPEHLERLGYSLECDRILFVNAAQMRATAPRPFEVYDLQIVQVPMASIVLGNEYARLPFNDLAAHEAFFEGCVQRLEMILHEGLSWSDRILTFAPNYLSPQQNLMGRMTPRYDLRNPIYLVERLNQELDRIVSGYPGVHLIDANNIASVCGKRFLAEDSVWQQFHGGFINEDAEDHLSYPRVDPSPPISEVYDFAADEYVGAVWQEIRAVFRTLKRVDTVKMLCIDLDDTMWRGVIGEVTHADKVPPGGLIGWPLGLLEALLFLKKRGVILAIISKNDESRTRAIWDSVFLGNIALDDFAIVKINWRPKAENIAEAIAEANILPNSVVFLDDNPVERAAVVAALPDVRAISSSQYEWRRILGWSAELQTPSITEESTRRTSMVQAQLARDASKVALSRNDFLMSLNLRVAVEAIREPSGPRFERAFELINKTNQFNTTGVRWSEQDAIRYLSKGGVWWVFEVADRFTQYGLVGVCCLRGERLDQFVMSCRVAGLDIEANVIGVILERSGSAETAFCAEIRETESNAVVRDLFDRMGWQETDGLWRGSGRRSRAAHISFTNAGAPVTAGGT